MGRRHEQTFLQRRHTDGEQTHEKMLNITNHERNANQNYYELSNLTPVRMAKINTRNNKVLTRMWRKRTSVTLLAGMQTDAATLENSMEVHQKVKNRATL